MKRVFKKILQPAQNFQRLGSTLHRIHQDKNLFWVPLVLDAQAQGMDGVGKLLREPALIVIALAGILIVILATGALAMVVVMGVGCPRGLRDSMGSRCGVLRGPVLGTDHAEGLALDFKERTSAGFAGLFKHFASLEEVLCHNFIFFS
jgi:hypothetical protein